MDPADIEVLVITRDEEANLERTLAALSFARRVLVLDSGSTDATLAIAARFANVEVATRPFDRFAAQCNHGLSLLASDWVLSLDADHVLGAGFADELRALPPSTGPLAYRMRFEFWIGGRALKRSLLPPRVALFRRDAGRFEDDGHAHRVAVDGPVGQLATPIAHDDRKPLSRWLSAQWRYAEQEADKLGAADPARLSLPDRLRRRIVIAPWLVFGYVLFARGLALDGWRGWHYAMQRLIAEAILSLALVDRRLRGATDGGTPR